MLFIVTNRKLTKNFNDFIERITIMNNANINGVIIREKDLTHENYEILIKKILSINKNIIINSNINIAYKFNIPNIQLSFYSFKLNYHYIKSCFKNIFVSVHNLDEAIYASNKGANYIILGHIFKTECKKNMDPIGTELLKKIYDKINTPILTIGGINTENITDVFKNGASGICLMSEMMQTQKLKLKIQEYQNIIRSFKI